jgi:hypothetical protein
MDAPSERFIAPLGPVGEKSMFSLIGVGRDASTVRATTPVEFVSMRLSAELIEENAWELGLAVRLPMAATPPLATTMLGPLLE